MQSVGLPSIVAVSFPPSSNLRKLISKVCDICSGDVLLLAPHLLDEFCMDTAGSVWGECLETCAVYRNVAMWSKEYKGISESPTNKAFSIALRYQAGSSLLSKSLLSMMKDTGQFVGIAWATTTKMYTANPSFAVTSAIRKPAMTSLKPAGFTEKYVRSHIDLCYAIFYHILSIHLYLIFVEHDSFENWFAILVPAATSNLATLYVTSTPAKQTLSTHGSPMHVLACFRLFWHYLLIPDFCGPTDIQQEFDHFDSSPHWKMNAQKTWLGSDPFRRWLSYIQSCVSELRAVLFLCHSHQQQQMKEKHVLDHTLH